MPGNRSLLERPGPIRHESLPPELLERIGAVFNLIGAHLNMTLESFEIGFMRDANPESEVSIWCGIAGAWLRYHEQFTQDKLLSDAEEKTLLSALIQISSGIDDPAELCVSPEIGNRLLACCGGDQ